MGTHESQHSCRGSIRCTPFRAGVHARHKMGQSCSDNVCRWNKVTSNVDFQRKTETPMFPTGYEYFCQENAWMDEGAMLEWDELILTLFIATH